MQDCDTAAYWLPKTRDEVEYRIAKYLNFALSHQYGGFTINDDLSVSYGGPINLKEKNLLELPDGLVIPIKFKSVGVNFVIECPDLISLEGCPNVVCNDFTITSNRIKTLIGGPMGVGNHYFIMGPITSIEGICAKTHNLNIVSDKLTSLKNIHKYLKEVTRTFFIPSGIKSNILGLFYVENITLMNSDKTMFNADMRTALEILTHHKFAKSDILACQEDMITSGLKDFARL